MKRTATLTGLFMSLVIGASAQTALPYNTGFDNAAQKTGWQEFRKGNTAHMNWTYHTDFNTGHVPASNPDCIAHTYPTTTPATQDWFVSPSLNLSTGAKVQLKINVYSPGGTLEPGDSIQLYLLKGNADPALASSKTMLTSFSYMKATTFTYKDTAGIIVPPTTGQAYLAFKYSCINNWFTVAIDDIKVTANPSTGINDVETTVGNLIVYPNPAKGSIRWSYTGTAAADKLEAQLADVAGRIIKSVPLKNKELNISSLKPGIYFLKSGGKAIAFTKE